ncbi:anti-lipopolysaccharide factor-like [Oratosquilla oratoria]|uniref:anti-lipopolysaccharide factor-like n=1 Tax=Oratosquilla oratoria TaxID=337810 RepID=UPI003F769B82
MGCPQLPGSRGPLMLVLLILALGARTTDAGFIDDLFVTLVGEVSEHLWKRGKMNLFDRECNYLTRPLVRKFELRYEGRVWCPGWVPFDGKSRPRANPDHAHQEAVEKFIQQVEEEKLVDPADIDYWRKNY